MASEPKARQFQPVLLGALDGDVIARIGMAHDAARRIVPQHPLQASRRIVAAVADDHHAGMLRIADADAAAMMDRNPGGARGRIQQALSNGQSDTASEPSIIASVSRLGEATEPESR